MTDVHVEIDAEPEPEPEPVEAPPVVVITDGDDGRVDEETVELAVENQRLRDENMVLAAQIEAARITSEEALIVATDAAETAEEALEVAEAEETHQALVEPEPDEIPGGRVHLVHRPWKGLKG